MSDEWSDEGSEATFSDTAKEDIHALYHESCAICLFQLPAGEKFAHLIASSEDGDEAIELGVYLGLIESSYERLSAENGFLLCGTCNASYFSLHNVALSPPPIVLRYILQSLHKPENFTRPVYEICQSLVYYSHYPQNAPDDMKDVLPYVGLYSLVTLNPVAVRWCAIMSMRFPPLSTIENFRFVPASGDADPSSPDNARIFDALSITSNMPISLGIIPLTDARSEEYTQKRYWRLPFKLEAVLTEFLARTNRATCHARDSEQYYSARIRTRCSTLKYQLEDMEAGIDWPGDGEGEGGVVANKPDVLPNVLEVRVGVGSEAFG
ncbi:hypothetical protein BD410DRAFT_899335 [Rickenella mellea]|uniref:Uncharacterized protein n=1 Tax=Rickenella mellea TaxID=50990 RepID=A0A4Y7Q0M4_9AGAM|nr:hypothetical protein BD410DRAFT_899335 [Rickenella mellea]